MPKYDYRCSAGHQYEKREGFDAPALQTCAVCGIAARRVLTPPAIVFKGSGWYAIDSRPSGSADRATSPSESTSKDGAAPTATETKTETKTEAKSESNKTEGKRDTASSTTSLAAD